MDRSPLIEPAELAKRLGEPGLRIVDTRAAISEPGEGHRRYLEAHIPGAVFADLDLDLSGESGPGRHPLPTPEQFASTLGRLGIGPETLVVAYDDSGGSIASRLWWMLESIGHAEVAVLHGGWQAWQEASHPTSGDVVSVEPVSYPTPARFNGVVEMDELVSGRVTLVDARERERYRGDVEHLDPRPGHIPGAINVPYTESIKPDMRLLNPPQLVERFDDLPDDVVLSCGSGVTSCHVALAMRVAGRPMPRLYIGSYSEWSRTDNPVVSGDEP